MSNQDETNVLLREIRDLLAKHHESVEERNRLHTLELTADSKRAEESVRVQREMVRRQVQATEIQRCLLAVLLILLIAVILS